jgi:PAS domain S-box-containing protein
MAGRANPNLKQRALVVAGIAIAIIVVMVVNQVWQTRGVTVTTARRDVQQFGQILEANTDITLQSMTLILDHVVETARGRSLGAVAAPVTDRFISIADNWALIHSVALITRNGTIRDAASRGSDGRLHGLAHPLDVSDRPIFRFLRDSDSARGEFYIIRPQADLVSGVRVIAITKVILDDAGAFLGACIVTVSVEAFTKLYAALLPARYTSVELFRRDGILLVSTDANRRNEVTSQEKSLVKEIISSSSAGVFRIRSLDDGNGNLLSYRALQRYPIVLSVKASWLPFMERWRESSKVWAASALFGVLVIVAFTVWLIRRITAEQAAQQALIENERRLLEAQRLSGIGYYEHAVRNGKLAWSSNMYDIHGRDPKTFDPGETGYLDMVVAEDKPKVFSAYRAFEENPASGHLECRIMRPDGQIRHIRYSWKILDAGISSPASVFGVAQDVTAIRNAEDIIRDDEERMRDIVECSSDYIWELNSKGAITLFNAAAIMQFGANDGAGLKILTSETSDVDDGDIAFLRQTIRNRLKFRSLLVPVKNTEGDVRWVRISGNPRFDTHGRYLGYRGAGTDVTELYHRQERNEAHRKAEALGRLASGMAHEINNLLQPIVIYANLGASEKDLAGTIRQYFNRIGLAAERSMMIVKNVLAFARQTPPSRESVNVGDAVRETVDLLSGTLPAGAVITFNEETDDLCVRVDRTGLTQVLTNLVTNAAEALPGGGSIDVSVNAVNLTPDVAQSLVLVPGLYCRLKVEDTGWGIPPDQLGKVFDPFFTTKSQGKGTGLGLSVVSGLARSWGGTVTVESIAGTGTCFTVYLPIAERHLQAAQ